MKKAIFAIFAAAAVSAFAAEAPVKNTLAVYGVKATPALAQKLKADGRAEALDRVVQAMDSQLSSAFAEGRKFTVLARSDWGSVMREQDFGASGNVSAESAAKVGKALGAKFVLETTVDDFQDYIETASFQTINKTAQKRILRFGAVAKLYDSTTGALTETANFVITNDDVADLPNYSIRNGNLNDALVGDIARMMARKIAARISDAAYPARVLSVIGNQIMLNRGDATGIAAGDTYKIMALGEKLVDPDTGEVLGSAEADVGLAVVTEVLPKFSKAVLTQNFGVEKGQIARKTDSSAALPAASAGAGVQVQGTTTVQKLK